jgi:hypothetical protein
MTSNLLIRVLECISGTPRHDECESLQSNMIATAIKIINM